jgi:hypothetical protein
MPKAQKKYEFTGETKEFSGHTLHRIRAVRDFDNEACHVKAGDLGGWIESDKNLDQDYTAWVTDEAMVYGKASVAEEALVSGHAQVFGEAIVTGGAVVTDNARIFGDAFILDFVKIYGDTQFCGDTMVSDAVYDHGIVMHTAERDVKMYFIREPGVVWNGECSRDAITDDGRYMEITCKAPDLKRKPGESEDEYEARLIDATEWETPIRVTDIHKGGKRTVVAENGSATFSPLCSGITVWHPDEE